MHPDLERCRDGLERALAGLSPADAEVSSNGAWSVAKIIEHLDLTYTRNADGLARRLAKRDAPERRRTLRQIIARFVVVVLGHFPKGRSSPPMVVPQGRPFADVNASLDADLIQLDKSLSEAERVFGARRAVLDHPVIGPFSVADWRRFHWVHTRHHIRQINERRGR